MSEPAFTHDVFLSHGSMDKALVCAVAEWLRNDGLKVLFDEWELKAGDSIPAKIKEGLEHSRVLACPAEASARRRTCPTVAARRRRMLCISANAFGSDWAHGLSRHSFTATAEGGHVPFRDPLNKERRFIPLRLDAAPIKDSLVQRTRLHLIS